VDVFERIVFNLFKMFKILINFIFIISAICSPLSNIGVDLHQLEVPHQSMEGTHKHSVIDHKGTFISRIILLGHINEGEQTPHRHYKNYNEGSDHFKSPLSLLPEPLEYLSVFAPLILNSLALTDLISQYLLLALNPSPDLFRNLPLLN